MKWIPAFAALALTVLSAQDFDAGLRAYEKEDYANALKEWRPLADQGQPRAQFLLGLLYYDGKGVPQDYPEAVKWFQQSADRGYARAQHNLGEMYATGQGVKRDYVLAYKWLNLCAAAGTDNCADHRDLIAKKLKASQLEKAQRMSREFQPIASSGSEPAAAKPQ